MHGVVDVTEHAAKSAEAPSGPLLEVRDLTVEFATRRGTVTAVSQVNLTLAKGETLIDTALNLEAMHPDLVVMRHSAAGAHALLARHMKASVINAGDGAHEHPTQALLDAYTLRKRLGRLEGLKVAIVGDIRHSRVVRSNLWLLTKMGAKVTLVGPPTLLPMEMKETWPDRKSVV